MTRRPIELFDPLYDQITNKVQKSYPDACICWIDMITNEELKERYDKFKKNIQHLLNINYFTEQKTVILLILLMMDLKFLKIV